MANNVINQEIPNPIVVVNNLNLFYGRTQALFDIAFKIPRNLVTALIGPSGCGKSTFLRCLNRMNDLIDGVTIEGSLKLDDIEINNPTLDVIQLRRRVGMVFQKYTPFPKTIYENIVYGLRIAGVSDRQVLDETMERSLKRAALWDEVKDRLQESALGLSGRANATIVHCARSSGGSGNHPDGRALLRSRPTLHCTYRRLDR